MVDLQKKHGFQYQNGRILDGLEVPQLLGNLHYSSIAKGQSSMLVLEKFVDVHLFQRPSGFWRKERGAPLIHLQSLCTCSLHITYCTMGIG